MNKSLICKSLLAALLMTGAAGVMAAAPTSVVTVSGKVTTQTCVVASGDVNKTVALTSNGDSSLLNASNLIPVTFSFGISGCDSSLTKATATIGGTTASSDVTGYGTNGVIANTGTATNVGIGFLGASSVGSTPAGVLPVGTASAVATLAAVGSATTNSGTLYLGAQIVPLVKATLPVAGTVAGTATVTFTYS